MNKHERKQRTAEQSADLRFCHEKLLRRICLFNRHIFWYRWYFSFHLTLVAGRLFKCVLFVIVFIVWLAIVSNDSVCIDSFTFGSFESFELISLSVLLVLASMLIYLLLFFWQRKWCLYSPVLVTHSIACIHPWQLSHKSSNEQTKNTISLIIFDEAIDLLIWYSGEIAHSVWLKMPRKKPQANHFKASRCFQLSHELVDTLFYWKVPFNEQILSHFSLWNCTGRLFRWTASKALENNRQTQCFFFIRESNKQLPLKLKPLSICYC